ncbi:uncharacterized protein LOC8085166 isoform X2 [Sorghum bicolor]|uniref:uncharacterized protein LOC8085166 isoform X2 n=1 Tax=Sorghum bicolor TaxID=4558 RepID=UPI000B426378|nr:uncharacterized protein LOC8085166 isoform X2 [Sorghum bicolor]|eukprot:XP_021314878.1 uncharacterized protein LOC8085166 isoform X2 [Sorghum bicolor]
MKSSESGMNFWLESCELLTLHLLLMSNERDSCFLFQSLYVPPAPLFTTHEAFQRAFLRLKISGLRRTTLPSRKGPGPAPAAPPRPPPLRGAGRKLEMPRDRDEPAAVRVYTVCDESRYLIVRNVPSLGCGDDLANLFGTYGPVEECTPMDAEDCEPYTDVFFVKFSQVNNARFAKRKLDESVFLGNRLQHLLADLKGHLSTLQLRDHLVGITTS